MKLRDVSQSELSRITGVSQGRISQYLTGKLEPSEPTLERLVAGLGLEITLTVQPVTMERTKLRSWMLHREVSKKLSDGIGEQDWLRLSRNLDKVRSGTRGQPHERNITRWQQIIDHRDQKQFRRVLTDTSVDGIEMREVSPVKGFLTEDERLDVLSRVPR
jgi:transcriptional regulator with XRE-family HTH domain